MLSSLDEKNLKIIEATIQALKAAKEMEEMKNAVSFFALVSGYVLIAS